MDLVLRTSSRSDTKVRYVMTCLGGWFKKPSEDYTHSPTLYAQGFKGT